MQSIESTRVREGGNGAVAMIGKTKADLAERTIDSVLEKVFGQVKWRRVDCTIKGKDGNVVFSCNAEFPDFWDYDACCITASKYFRKINGRIEDSLKSVIGRVVRFIALSGYRNGYFNLSGFSAGVFPWASDNAIDSMANFAERLCQMLLHQKAAFNSPVWFNVGVVSRPQTAACFLLSVSDSMSSILDWVKTEGMIFKSGSGAGVNISSLRAAGEPLSTGGVSSGPLAFMRAADTMAGVIKSGGATRRAAKMVVMNIDHPDILDFIYCKMREEKKAHALISAGYDSSIDGEAYGTVAFQNANHSIRVTNEFMLAVTEDRDFATRYVSIIDPASGGRMVAKTYKAKDLFRAICEAAWHCGDPGLQFDDTIQDWHTCPSVGPITTSNPCSEVMHLDNSCCNLASINLVKFFNYDEFRFLVDDFIDAVKTLIVAQDILIDVSSYPTKDIEYNAINFRQLGLGFSNLGALLMSTGVAYDSATGRDFAASIAAIMCGTAYSTSANLSALLGYSAQIPQQDILRVLRKHLFHAKKLADSATVFHDLDRFSFIHGLAQRALDACDQAVHLGELHGIRNSQVTAIAPTGTISFMMGCDTTGIEPELSLVKIKNLVGGGSIKLVNRSVERALTSLGYSAEYAGRIVKMVVDGHDINDLVKPDHGKVFETSLPSKNGFCISPMAHLKMMAAVQPFISGAISKTINMPRNCTVEDIGDVFMAAWNLGLKAVAVYRDGCKLAQPLETLNDETGVTTKQKAAGAGEHRDLPTVALTPVRRRVPESCTALRHKFSVAGHDGYLHIGLFGDGSPGEVFIRVSKEGSTIAGLMDTIGILTSLALQYGVPLDVMVNKLSYMSFEPSGITNNEKIRFAKSIVDYIFRYLGYMYCNKDSQKDTDVEVSGFTCAVCGGIMVRSGTCLTCTQCGNSSGGCS